MQKQSTEPSGMSIMSFLVPIGLVYRLRDENNSYFYVFNSGSTAFY
jgi:hypothetical protein